MVLYIKCEDALYVDPQLAFIFSYYNFGYFTYVIMQ
jgi:hypothetical protein